MSGAALTDRDLDILARTIYGEARNQSFVGMCAVGHVIWNRTQEPQKYGMGIIGVCLRRKQFSCWNDDDPNRIFIMAAQYHETPFLKCVSAAAQVLSDGSGIGSDPTKGATHYHTGAVHPAWDKNMVVTAEIGAHVFYKEK